MKTGEKTISLKYLYQWIDEDGIRLPEYRYKQITTNHTKRYHNCLYLLAGLNSSCRDLMDYLCERMDNNNHVHSNETVREDFIDFIRRITGDNVEYSHATVKKAFKILTDKGLLISLGRGSYMVNPEFFFRREEKDRLEAIRLVLEFKSDSI